ncbi:MAG: hypothetical protein C0524_12325 [Rhodobacter sp.]|nr:hypothetical protein [Rhodobacter sp.]
MDTVLEWVTRQWLEIVGVAVTIAALIYAHLAYRTSALGLAHAKQAELTNLRIQTKAALNDARQAQVSLELSCQIYRTSWASHERMQPMTMSAPGSFGLFKRSPIDDVQHEGRQLLQQLDALGATVDDMDLQALEALQQKAKATSLAIQALAGRLEGPP